MSLDQTVTAFRGVTVLVDLSPSQKLLGGVLDPSGCIPLAIPPDPSLTGIQGFAQTVHREAGGWAASDGVRFTLL